MYFIYFCYGFSYGDYLLILCFYFFNALVGVLNLQRCNINIDHANKDNSSLYYFENEKEPTKDSNKEMNNDFLLPYCI